MQLYIRSAPRFKIPHLCNLWYLGIFVAQVAMHCPRKVKHFALEKCVYIFADNWGVALEELNSPKSVPKWKQSATEAARNAGNIPSQSQLINVVVHGIFGCRKLLTNIMPVYPAHLAMSIFWELLPQCIFAAGDKGQHYRYLLPNCQLGKYQSSLRYRAEVARYLVCPRDIFWSSPSAEEFKQNNTVLNSNLLVLTWSASA